MSKRLILGMVLAVAAVLLAACEVEEEGEGPDATPTQATATAEATPTAETTPTPTLPESAAELQRLREEDDAKPRFEGVINGIRLYPTGGGADERTDACTGAKPEDVQHVDMSAVAGTAMEIIPTYLPSGAEEQDPMWPPVVCKGILTSVERWWVIRGKGIFHIARRQGEHAFASGAPADRLSASTIGGKPAVLVAPLTPEGYGQSAVIVAEEFGLTIVWADGLPLEEMVRVAEGLR